MATNPEVYEHIMNLVKGKRKYIVGTATTGMTDEELLVVVMEVEQAIKNYCRIPEVVYPLYYVWANMAVDLALYQIESNKDTSQDDPISSIDPSDVSSIKVGDTSLGIGGSGSSTTVRGKVLNSHIPNLDEIVMNYKAQLNQFRWLL